MKGKIKSDFFLLGILVFLHLLLRFYRLTSPWIGRHDWNGAFFSQIGRNYLRFGWLTTRFGPTVYQGKDIPLRFPYELHHPPLPGLFVSLSFLFLGIKEWSARLVPISLSVGSLFLVYFWVKKLWGKKWALLSSLFFASFPLSVYYGRMVGYEPITLFFILLSLYFYTLWLEKGKNLYLFLLYVFFGVGTFSDWPTYFLVPLLLFHYFIWGRKKRKSLLFLSLPLLGVSLFLLFFFYSWWLRSSSPILYWKDAFFIRFGPHPGWEFTWADFLKKEWLRGWFLFTPPLVFLSTIWLSLFFVGGERGWREGLLFSLFLLGLFNILLFRQGAWVHDYWLFYFVPFVSVASSLSLRRIFSFFFWMGKRKDFVISLFLVFLFYFYSLSSYRGLKFLYGETHPLLYELGKSLHELTLPEDKLMGSFPSKPEVMFYLDREYRMVTTLEEFKRKRLAFKWYVFVPFFPLEGPSLFPEEELLVYLKRNFPSREGKGFIIFRLKDGKDTPP